MFRTKTNPFVTNEAKVTKGLMCPELQAPGLSHLSRDILHWSDRESKHLWHYQCNMIYFYLFLNCKLMVMIRLVSGYTWDVNPFHTENTGCDLMLPKVQVISDLQTDWCHKCACVGPGAGVSPPWTLAKTRGAPRPCLSFKLSGLVWPTAAPLQLSRVRCLFEPVQPPSWGEHIYFQISD